jgi:hypothetical protein
MSKTKVTPEQFKAELELQDRFATIFRTNGWDPVADKNVDINDALDIQNAAFMIPKAMTTIVQEGIEPIQARHDDRIPGRRASACRGNR